MSLGGVGQYGGQGSNDLSAFLAGVVIHGSACGCNSIARSEKLST